MGLVSSLIRTLTSIYVGSKSSLGTRCSILNSKKHGRFNAELGMWETRTISLQTANFFAGNRPAILLDCHAFEKTH